MFSGIGYDKQALFSQFLHVLSPKTPQNCKFYATKL